MIENLNNEFKSALAGHWSLDLQTKMNNPGTAWLGMGYGLLLINWD
jgi:hypothetical protein